MEFTLDIQTLVFILVQFTMMVIVINNNRNMVKYQEHQHNDQKDWFEELQKTVNELRAKVGE